MAKPKNKIPLQPTMDRPFNNPLAGLAHVAVTARGEAPATNAPVTAPEASQANSIARAVLRMERKGRGGKTITLVQQTQLDAKGLTALAKQLRQGLGCGATVDGEDIVLQGDQRERARDVLTKLGVKRVSG